MYKCILITLVILLLTGFSCEKIDLPGDVPDCIEKKARELSSEPVRNPPAQIVEWTLLSGEKYYYIPPYCCDMFSELYDTSCRLICAPDGGFSGGGDGRCPGDILVNLMSVKVIWEDDRDGE